MNSATSYQITRDILFCRCYLTQIQQKANYGAPRFKPNMLKTKPKRKTSMLALDNFDFYYGPLFGKKWPSIRLGLLTPHKFAAIVNRFSESFEVYLFLFFFNYLQTNREIIKSLGTINLVDNLTKDREISEGKGTMNLKKQELDDKLSHQMGHCQEIQQKQIRNEEPEEFDLDSRFESSINQFLPPTREIRYGRFESAKKDEDKQFNARRRIYDQKFKVTGLEAVDAEPLEAIEEVPAYPRGLEVFMHQRMCIDGFPGPIRDKNNISGWWLLDGSSIVPVLALGLKDDDLVLDMCAAPGGKSLLITQTDKFANLVCNDNKLSRLGQLRRSLAMYIPADSEVSSRITIKRKDAASVESWDDIGIYDKVLADVPCTTDRMSANYDIGNIFATERSTERLDLPQLQTKILVNALRAAHVGGSVVYSTCTLAPTQNEMVVENAAVLARENYGIECVERSLKRMEKHLAATGCFRFNQQQRRGSLVLPNLVSNFGPMYICKLQRIK